MLAVGIGDTERGGERAEGSKGSVANGVVGEGGVGIEAIKRGGGQAHVWSAGIAAEPLSHIEDNVSNTLFALIPLPGLLHKF